jgi:hypothetical protein
MCDGVQFVTAFNDLATALTHKRHIEYSGGGCCDVVKKRFIPGQDKPIHNTIYNSYRYSEFDL